MFSAFSNLLALVKKYPNRSSKIAKAALSLQSCRLCDANTDFMSDHSSQNKLQVTQVHGATLQTHSHNDGGDRQHAKKTIDARWPTS